MLNITALMTAVAYCLCGICIDSTKARIRAARTIEAMARDMAEREGAK